MENHLWHHQRNPHLGKICDEPCHPRAKLNCSISSGICTLWRRRHRARRRRKEAPERQKVRSTNPWRLGPFSFVETRFTRSGKRRSGSVTRLSLLDLDIVRDRSGDFHGVVGGVSLESKKHARSVGRQGHSGGQRDLRGWRSVLHVKHRRAVLIAIVGFSAPLP